MNKTDLILQISYRKSTLDFGGYEVMKKLSKPALEKIYAEVVV